MYFIKTSNLFHPSSISQVKMCLTYFLCSAIRNSCCLPCYLELSTPHNFCLGCGGVSSRNEDLCTHCNGKTLIPSHAGCIPSQSCLLPHLCICKRGHIPLAPCLTQLCAFRKVSPAIDRDVFFPLYFP